MNDLRKDSSGFGVIAIVFVLVVVGLVGTLGWVAYKNFRNTHKASVATTNTSHETSHTPEVSTADWTTYVGSDNKISFKYPKSWLTAAHPELCSKGTVLLAPTADSLGICGSDTAGQVSVSWKASSQTCDNFGSDSGSITYDDGTVVKTAVNQTKENVTVSGVSGIKRTSVSTGDGPYAWPKGTFDSTYCFNYGGYIYTAQYLQKPSYPDAKSDFDTMVTKTLRFSQ